MCCMTAFKISISATTKTSRNLQQSPMENIALVIVLSFFSVARQQSEGGPLPQFGWDRSDQPISPQIQYYQLTKGDQLNWIRPRLVSSQGYHHYSPLCS